MNILDQLAFGPGRDRWSWIKGTIFVLLAVGIGLGGLYYSLAIDYSFLRASLYTGSLHGQYDTVGRRLEARAGAKGGNLKVVETAGALENISRLAGRKGKCIPGFAFVQDGLPIPADAGIEVIGRLPEPESLLLLARRGRETASFNDFRNAVIGVGPVGSGTDNLMRHLLDKPDMGSLDLKPVNYGYGKQVDLMTRGEIDFAATVMNENAELVRDLVKRYDLEIVSPRDIEGLIARERWLRLGRIPAGFFDVTRPNPPIDKLVAQVDTLVMANACVHRAERVAMLMLLAEEFPDFIRSNPPVFAKSQETAPLAEEARKFYAVGEPEFADKYFPRFVNLLSPAYWLYLVMVITILFNVSDTYSRFRLWRIDANREHLEARLKALTASHEAHAGHEAIADARGGAEWPERAAALALLADFELLQERCRHQLKSIVTPMGSEMYYRYQEALIDAGMQTLAGLLERHEPSL